MPRTINQLLLDQLENVMNMLDYELLALIASAALQFSSVLQQLLPIYLGKCAIRCPPNLTFLSP